MADEGAIAEAQAATWSALDAGANDEALDAARTWARLDPDSQDAGHALLIVLSADPRWRAEAIGAREAWLAANPDDEGVVLGLAYLLAEEDGNEDAASVLEDWLAGHPDAIDARLLRARVLSWSGRFAQARREIDHAGAVAPTAPQVHVARADVALQLGREVEAARAIDLARSLDPQVDGLAEATRRLETATRPGGVAALTFASETSGLTRLATSAQVFSWADDQTLFDATLDAASFHSIDRVFVRVGLTGRMVVELPSDLSLDLGLAGQWVPGNHFQPRWNGELVWTPAGAARISVGVRRRAIVDDPVVQGTALPPLIGTAGARMDDIARGLDQDEGFVRASASPVRGLDGWLEAAGGAVEGNARASVSAGVSYDVLASTGSSHGLYARYELYFLAFARETPDYYSPPGASSHAPGVEWHWRSASGHQLVALAAPILQLGAPVGEMVGVSGRLHLSDHVELGLGVRHQGNRYYRITGASTWMDVRL